MFDDFFESIESRHRLVGKFNGFWDLTIDRPKNGNIHSHQRPVKPGGRSIHVIHDRQIEGNIPIKKEGGESIIIHRSLGRGRERKFERERDVHTHTHTLFFFLFFIVFLVRLSKDTNHHNHHDNHNERMPSILDPLKPSPPPSISSSIQHQRLCSHHSHSHHHLSIRRIRPQYIFRGFAVLLGILYIFLTTRIHMFVNEDERQEKQVQPLAGATRKTGSTSTTTTTLSVLLPPTSSSLSSFSSLKKKKTKAKISSSVQQQQRAFVKDDGIINQSSFSSTMTTKEEEGVIVKTTTTWEVPKIQKQRPKLLLQEKLDASFHETGIFYQGDLWDLSDYIPQWMKGTMTTTTK